MAVAVAVAAGAVGKAIIHPAGRTFSQALSRVLPVFGICGAPSHHLSPSSRRPYRRLGSCRWNARRDTRAPQLDGRRSARQCTLCGWLRVVLLPQRCYAPGCEGACAPRAAVRSTSPSQITAAGQPFQASPRASPDNITDSSGIPRLTAIAARCLAGQGTVASSGLQDAATTWYKRRSPLRRTPLPAR